MNLACSVSLSLSDIKNIDPILAHPSVSLYPIGCFLHSRTQRLVVEEQQLLLQPQITAAGIDKLQLSIQTQSGKT